MNIEVVVTTAPRGEPTLDATIDSLAAAGWRPVQISPDDQCRLGPWGNYKAALRDALRTTTSPAVAIVQDDVEVAVGLRPWLEAAAEGLLGGDTGVVSLWTCRWHGKNTVPHLPWHAFRDGFWWAMPAEDLPRRVYGALGHVWLRSRAEALLAADVGQKSRTKTDLWVGRWCRDAGLAYVSPARSLMRHTGRVSSIGPDVARNPAFTEAADPVLAASELPPA